MAHRHQRLAPVGEYTPLRVNAAGTLIPVGNGVNTTSATTIVAGSNVTVTPASMSGIFVGQKLNFANGTGTAETVMVKQVPSGGTTFVADFVNNHSGAYTITSVSGTFLGRIIFMNAGTGMTLTLYNGSPNVLPLPSKSGIFLVIPTASVVLGQSQDLEVTLDYGLFYTYTGTTPGDFTLTYIDQPVA